MKTLPTINRIIARYLFEFLSRVTQNANVNKMHANNLAIVFAPSLLRTESACLLSSSSAVRVVEVMITQVNKIFKVCSQFGYK